MSNKLTIDPTFIHRLCVCVCVKINVHANEWFVLISFRYSFTHATRHSTQTQLEFNSSNRYGYFNTLVFGYYLSLNTNTCALWAIGCTEKRQFVPKITTTFVAPNRMARWEWHRIWTIKSHHCRHLTGSHINMAAPTRLCSSSSLFSSKYSLTASQTHTHKSETFLFQMKRRFYICKTYSCQTNVQPVVFDKYEMRALRSN